MVRLAQKTNTEDTTLIGDDYFHTPKQNTPTDSLEVSTTNSIDESINTCEMALTFNYLFLLI